MSTAESGSTKGSRLASPRVLGAAAVVAIGAAILLAVLLWPQPSQVLIVFPRRSLLFAGHMGVVLQNTDILAQNGIQARFEAPESREDLALLAEQADVVFTDESHALRLSARGDGTSIVANLGSAGRLGIVVPSGAEISSVQELRGARVATTKGTPAHRFLIEQTRAAGLTADDWQLVPADRNDQATSSAADAASLWDPEFFSTEAQETAKALATSELFATVVFSERLTGRHRDVGLAVLTAIKQAFHYLNEDPRQAAIWLAGDSGKPAARTQHACMQVNGNFARRRFISLVLSPELPSLRTTLEADNAFLVELGYLDQPANLDEIIQGSLMDQVDITAQPLTVIRAATKAE